ncbi:P2Y purinoceptor 8 [Synchiropus splendidus]|uniref:P2Y purinoceptor 8 n=1 Tax=Synchiropus splendidus TaxID=270530 RepID=UPI00237E44A6|nr:P2Y purinoceptor 8 [Synchiropus splendidus]
MSHNCSTPKLDNATLSLLQNVEVSITISVIYVVVTAVSLVGNLLSMWLLLFHTSPKTSSVIFMINLTLTDLSIGVALPFQIYYQLHGYDWDLGPRLCSYLTLVFYTNMYCSILTMMAIGIDRYLGIVRPMLFKQIQNKRSIAVVSCLFMWALVLSILYPLMTTDLTFHVHELEITTCFDILKKDMLPNHAAWSAFLLSVIFVLFFFPFCITTFCYVRVICKLAQDSKTEQKKRAIRLAVVVLLVYTLFFAPNNILFLTHSVLRLFYNRSLYMAYKLTLCFSCLNSCLDPFIYYFASKDFRQKLRQVVPLLNQSSTPDSTRMEQRESIYSTQCAVEARAGECIKECLMPHPSTA